MLIDFQNWKIKMCEWANSIHFTCKIIKHISVGSVGDSYTVEITGKYDEIGLIKVNQNAGGSDIEVVPSFLWCEYFNKKLINFDLSLFHKDFLDRLLNTGKIKSGNKIFDKTFGVLSSDKHLADKILSDSGIQSIFLKNRLLILNVNKKESVITFKNMATGLYEIKELDNMLNDFIYILRIINNILFLYNSQRFPKN